MTERVVIEGHDLAVTHHTDDEPAPDPVKRKRPPDYTLTAPTIDLGRLIEQLTADNPYWTPEANAWAEAHPDTRPKDAAKRWKRHRIEQEAA